LTLSPFYYIFFFLSPTFFRISCFSKKNGNHFNNVLLDIIFLFFLFFLFVCFICNKECCWIFRGTKKKRERERERKTDMHKWWCFLITTVRGYDHIYKNSWSILSYRYGNSTIKTNKTILFLSSFNFLVLHSSNNNIGLENSTIKCQSKEYSTNIGDRLCTHLQQKELKEPINGERKTIKILLNYNTIISDSTRHKIFLYTFKVAYNKQSLLVIPIAIICLVLLPPTSTITITTTTTGNHFFLMS
jgi:cbb3-type cytochrome oxidase subunit 3